MIGDDEQRQEEGVVSRGVDLGGRRVPRVPDLSAGKDPLRRPNPFILDDFSGSNAYKETKP